MTYKVEYDIPPPEGARRRGPALYPFADMKPGGSFAVPCATAEEQDTVAARVKTAASYFRRSNKGMRFVVRPVTEKEALLVRCWCMKEEEEE